MQLLNIVYRYVNRFINSEELLLELTNIDKTKLSFADITNISSLLKDVQNIISSTDIIIDEEEITRIKTINNILKVIEKIRKNSNLNENTKEFLSKKYTELLEDKAAKRDSGPRYEKLSSLLVNNKVYQEHLQEISIDELLKFITQYISVPKPLKLSPETFARLVSKAINNDNREGLWRLAFNYASENQNLDAIEDYYIEQKDAYYLMEYINAVKEHINLKKIVQKALRTKDINFINDCGKRAIEFGFFEDEEVEKIKQEIAKLDLPEK